MYQIFTFIGLFSLDFIFINKYHKFIHRFTVLAHTVSRLLPNLHSDTVYQLYDIYQDCNYEILLNIS